MSAGIESAIFALAEAINRLAITLEEPAPPIETPDSTAQINEDFESVCMDAAGVPTTFKRRCGICGEAGRYRSTHQDEMRDGTYHWVEVKT